jgi:hypothetical protein
MKTHKLHRFDTVFIVHFRFRDGTWGKDTVVARSEADARKKFRNINEEARMARIVEIMDTDESPYVYFGG